MSAPQNMALEQQQQHLILKQDGYLKVASNDSMDEFANDKLVALTAADGTITTVATTTTVGSNSAVETVCHNIVYHSLLNLLLVFDSKNQVKILDVHLGVVLQTTKLAENDQNLQIGCSYMPLQDKMLIWDKQNIGFRGDYNGVMLLDTVLQPAIMQNDDLIKFELLLSEAIIFQTSLKDLESEGLECPSDVYNELDEKIKGAQTNSKKGIKQQRWNTICLLISYSSLKLVANNVVVLLKRLERHIPALPIASAINERLTDLLSGSRMMDMSWQNANYKRILMHSEVFRRHTFEKWPHMDYKWALPDQMAQAGFYHEPSSSGQDRAMCFTCSVCLVCWEKTDEPWSEHERHSPLCPFVKGEYTQNVPANVTYATNPAITAPGMSFDVISNSEFSNVLVTSCAETGDISIWNIERQLKVMHTFHISNLMKDVCDESYHWARVTAICVLPNVAARAKIAAMNLDQPGGITIAPNNVQGFSTCTLRDGVVGHKIVLALSIRQGTGEHVLRLLTLDIIPSDRVVEAEKEANSSVVKQQNQPGFDKELDADACENNVYSTDIEQSAEQLLTPTFKAYTGKESLISDLMAMQNQTKFLVTEMNNMDLLNSSMSKQVEMDTEMTDIYDFNEVLENSLQETSNSAQVFEMDPQVFKVKLLATAKSYQKAVGNGNGNGNAVVENEKQATLSQDSSYLQRNFNEEIDVVVESCTTVKRMNSWSSDVNKSQDNGDNKLVVINEIKPTNGTCKQLLIKLVKTNAPDVEVSKIIMATVECMDVDEDTDADSHEIGGQILLVDYNAPVISIDYNQVITFISNKAPKQMCVLPKISLNFNDADKLSQTDITDGNNTPVGNDTTEAVCIVCADGTVEVYSMFNFQLLTVINENIVSIAYCASLGRLCACTRKGSLIFYSLNGNDDEGDDGCDAEEELTSASQLQLVQSSVANKSIQEMSVIDGFSGNTSNTFSIPTSLMVIAGSENSSESSLSVITQNKEECGGISQQSVVASDGTDSINAFAFLPQVSPTPSSSSLAGSNNSGNSLLAHKSSEYSIEELRILQTLTKFDDNLSQYTAEVPCCWNDLVQAQKQRKQSQNLRQGDDTQFTKTWRLHNDATTWDEHILELNLLHQVNLGHIDLKFSVYPQTQNPASIQVTLLKQNSNNFGYRLKTNNAAFKRAQLDNIEPANYVLPPHENPVLTDEYLQTHNAEVLAGPIDLSNCIDMSEQSGTVTLTSPKLFKTRTRNFLIHIKTMIDPAKESQNKTRVHPSQKCKGLLHKICKIIPQEVTESSKTETENKNKMTKQEKVEQVEKPCKHHHILKNVLSGTLPTFKTLQSTAKLLKYDEMKKIIKSQHQQKPEETTKAKYEYKIGCDWLHEISINVRGVKAQNRIPNERLQRIAMLESNTLVENLFKITSCAESSIMAKNLALDLLIWICFIRLNRFRSPKSERIKTEITKENAASNSDLLAQQFECIAVAEKYLENTIRYCIVRSERSMAHKCVKVIMLLSDGIYNLPAELQLISTFDAAMKSAVVNTFHELPSSKYASVVRWYSILTAATTTSETHHCISELCIKMLTNISKELETRWDPYCAILGTRFGLYGSPFEAELFDYDMPNVYKTNVNLPNALVNVIRTNTGLNPVPNVDFRKLSSIDGVDFRTFPHLIKCKSISNQLRGLLEVQQLHFTCANTSEATRIDNLDSATASGGASNINVEDLLIPPSIQISDNTKEDAEKLSDVVNNVQNYIVDKHMKYMKKFEATSPKKALKPNGVGPAVLSAAAAAADIKQLATNSLLPKFKAICQYIECCDESSQTNTSATTATKTPPSNYLSGINAKSMQMLTEHLKHKEPLAISSSSKKSKHIKPNIIGASTGINSGNNPSNLASTVCSVASAAQDTSNANSNNVLAWHKLLSPPPNQMIVVDRMHSGARRFVVLDFGMPILLTDLVIPACDELASLHIDIWNFDEATDAVRLVVSSDIRSKTLVLSDLQPPPICRFMKITFMGRIGISSTKCKIPIGSFYGHVIVLENDGYGDTLLRLMRHPQQHIKAQIRALSLLHDDVHCRFSLASCKLMELLTPVLNSELSNVAHMQAFIHKARDEDQNVAESNKIIGIYDECIMLQHQINVIRNVIYRLETALKPQLIMPLDVKLALEVASHDKLRVLSQCFIEVLLHFSIEYGIKNILPIYPLFTKEVASILFNSLVVYGEAHTQLATCSLLVRMCCFQSWWGDFLADLFCSLFSSQNSKVFPQDRIFFLLTYLGRRSIAMGTCRSIVIDAVLKTLAKLLAPISPRYQEIFTANAQTEANPISGLWSKSDLQLITWLLLFFSVCLDDCSERKDKSSARWDFMSCETDYAKSRIQALNASGKQLRCFKRRVLQQSKLGASTTPEWGKKIFMLHNEILNQHHPNHPNIFMDMAMKPKTTKMSKATGTTSIPTASSSALAALAAAEATAPSVSSTSTAPSTSTKSSTSKESNNQSQESATNAENNFEKGIKTIRLNNILVVVRGLIALLLEMDFSCNMDQFLLTCKVIARLVSASQPSVQLSKIITTTQLEQLIRIAVWNDQQHPWTVHAITCLLQDLLDADKHFKNIRDITPTNEVEEERTNTLETVHEGREVYPDYSASGFKYAYLPSLIECEDVAEFDDIINDIDMIDRSKPVIKKDTSTANRSTFNYFCRSISSAMDARLEVRLDLNIEMQLRRLNMLSSLDMYSSLPQVCSSEFVSASAESPLWPEYITEVWANQKYNSGHNTYKMFKDVFDCIFADLHLEDTWVHLEQVLQIWLTLNGELTDKGLFNEQVTREVPRIPFGANAVQGLLLTLAWHNDIKLRTWCLGFQCLVLACNSQAIADESDVDTTRMHEVILNDENFEKMLLRFFSGYGMSSSIITNRCAGPTICKHLHDLFIKLQANAVDDVVTSKRKLKDTLLHVILQLVQPGGAIANQQGPIDAQSQLVRDLLTMHKKKADVSVALNIIESISFLIFNHISNGEKLHCQRSTDANNHSSSFSSLFANVLGTETSKQITTISDNSVIINLSKLAAVLTQMELPRQPTEQSIPEEEELPAKINQIDASKTESINVDVQKTKTPCIADTVLRHFPTMKRLLGALTHCSGNSMSSMGTSAFYTIKLTESTFLFDEPQTAGDAVFSLLMTLCEKATNPRLIIAPICQYLEASSLQRYVMPKLQLSEPFLWYMSRVLEVPQAVQIFTQLGGIEIICKNLVKLGKVLVNLHPGMISMIMQHMAKNTKLKIISHTCAATAGTSSSSGGAKKASSSGAGGSNTHAQRSKLQDGLINFAPFCSITSENDTAQSADILIMYSVTSHRRPRNAAWSYMFYPNESHVDLTITMPTAILLKEVQLQPHTPTLASCPSAVALEISRDYGLGPIPVGPALSTTGMTCIRLKLSKPEIATSIVLRLYRPKDSSNIGLTQIAILGSTIFSPANALSAVGNQVGNNLSSSINTVDVLDDDSFAKTSVGWVIILARCRLFASMLADNKLLTDIISSSAAYPGFLEATCALMNIMPIIPVAAQHNLETVLLCWGSHSRELCLSIIRILLWGTPPQTYKVSNESICDLIFELCTAQDDYVVDKIQLLLEWIVKLRQNFNMRLMRCSNPQCGFVKCIASILWTVHAEKQLNNMCDIITPEIFDACMFWIQSFEHEEPLKLAFDSLLCSLCHIKPELFNQLMQRFKINLDAGVQTLDEDAASIENTPKVSQYKTAQIMQNVLSRPINLSTIAMAAQSNVAVRNLIASGLPKLLADALYQYCDLLRPKAKHTSTVTATTTTTTTMVSSQEEPTASTSTAAQSSESSSSSSSTSDKTPETEECIAQESIISCAQVPILLDFLSECSAEGEMRDWLGTQGHIFWAPLLEVLCNYKPRDNIAEVAIQQTFVRIERATINFFSRVTACHPKNQDILISLLIAAIRKPSLGSGKTISGFTRQIVLQLLLENERILVSVRSKQPLQKRDNCLHVISNSNNVNMCLVNNHPSRRINAHHLLFSVSTNAKCHEILQHCFSDPRAATNLAAVDNSGATITSTTSAAMKPFESLVNNGKVASKDTKADGDKSCQSDTYFPMFGNLENGMEYLSVAAGNTAKDKRFKDVKNQATAGNLCKDLATLPKMFSLSDFFNNKSCLSNDINECIQIAHLEMPDVLLTSDTTISQILAVLHNKGKSLATPCLTLNLIPPNVDWYAENMQRLKCSNVVPLPTPLQRFSSCGGLSLLAQYLPTVYPDMSSAARKAATVSSADKEKSPPMTEWVKLEANDEIYEDLEDPISEPAPKHAAMTSVPQHSLVAFGLFLRLPYYSDVLLRDKHRAQCLLRLVLGVTGDGEGNDIYSLSLASSLPTLPFEVFRQLLDSSDLSTESGLTLRRMVIEVGAMHLVLNCLAVFTHQSQHCQFASSQQECGKTSLTSGGTNTDEITNNSNSSDDKSHMYWAKGTGFGTGSTAQSWNVEQALMRQKSEEEHVTVLLQVISSYINPGDKLPISMECDGLAYHELIEEMGELPLEFLPLLEQSCLISALSAYLRNDSVLDITRHIPLYRGLLQLLRAISLAPQLVGFLQPKSSNEDSPSICDLLSNMKTCVDTYAKRLKVNKKSNIKGQTQQVTVHIDDGDDEGLALLIPDIHETAFLVQKIIAAEVALQQRDEPVNINIDTPLRRTQTIEQRYLAVMKSLQFDAFDIIVEADNNGYRFVVPYHFEKMVRMAGDRYHPSRVKRLAQEAVTLSTSLPLSYSSSVFVRCDTDRLDIMKVLITGPADTPYANGCFEFDVFFPPDYPNLPMLINLETTGRHSVRFNPNLYNDGKVCLSVLNTWHGRPEEKWNASTSSFLQVLVSIQSLILVPEPYFNEPGFERSRGTPSGTHSSREYNSNIYQACVRWAMLEQIRTPSACFKDVINKHFWLKRNEICEQIENWIEDLGKTHYNERNSRTISFNSMVLRRQYRHLREELAKLQVPEGMEDLDAPFSPHISLPQMTEPITNNTAPTTQSAAASTTTGGGGSGGGGGGGVSSSNSIVSGSFNNNNNAANDATKVATINPDGTVSIDNGAHPPLSQLLLGCYNLKTSAEALKMLVSSQCNQLKENMAKKGNLKSAQQQSQSLSDFENSTPTSPPSSSSCSDSTPVPMPMLIDLVNGYEVEVLDGVTSMLVPPMPPIAATAKVTTVESATTTPADDESAVEMEEMLEGDQNDDYSFMDDQQLMQAFLLDEEEEFSETDKLKFMD